MDPVNNRTLFSEGISSERPFDPLPVLLKLRAKGFLGRPRAKLWRPSVTANERSLLQRINQLQGERDSLMRRRVELLQLVEWPQRKAWAAEWRSIRRALADIDRERQRTEIRLALWRDVWTERQVVRVRSKRVKTLRRLVAERLQLTEPG